MNSIRNWLHIGKYRETLDARLLAAHKIGAILQLAALRDVKSHHPDMLIHPALWESLYTFYQEDVPFLNALEVIISSE